MQLKPFPGNSRQALHKQLCEAIFQMEIGEVLKSVQDEYCEDFYKYYLHDFVRSVHMCQHKKNEQEEAEYNVSISIVSMCLCIGGFHLEV